MDHLTEKFSRLGIDSAPGQESRRKEAEPPLRGAPLSGVPVDFSHGDVDAFPPAPGALQAFEEGVRAGGAQAYTEYRGKDALRRDLAQKLSGFTGASIDPEEELILTPGTQGALFLAVGAAVGRGDPVVIVEPDYFANRKLVEFFDGTLRPVRLNYEAPGQGAGLDLEALEADSGRGPGSSCFPIPTIPPGPSTLPRRLRPSAVWRSATASRSSRTSCTAVRFFPTPRPIPTCARFPAVRIECSRFWAPPRRSP